MIVLTWFWVNRWGHDIWDAIPKFNLCFNKFFFFTFFYLVGQFGALCCQQVYIRKNSFKGVITWKTNLIGPLVTSRKRALTFSSFNSANFFVQKIVKNQKLSTQNQKKTRTWLKQIQKVSGTHIDSQFSRRFDVFQKFRSFVELIPTWLLLKIVSRSKNLFKKPAAQCVKIKLFCSDVL